MATTSSSSSASVNTNEQSNVVNAKLSNITLEQNFPNPLQNSTSIRYNIPKDTKNTSLLITDLNGKTIKEINVTPGSGIVNLDASLLGAGTYTYTLIADGNKIDSKRMVIVK
jgi:hypothetical protein